MRGRAAPLAVRHAGWTGLCGGLLALLAACSMRSAEQASEEPDARAAIDGVWRIAQASDRLLTTDGSMPPLLPELQQVYEQHIAARHAGDRSWDPAGHCRPLGEPRAMLELSWPFEVHHSDERADILYQWNRLDHVIPMAAQHARSAGSSYFGESVGRWDGDTLVIDVIHIRADSMLDSSGMPHSGSLHLVERLRSINDGRNLEVNLHVSDPETFSSEWNARLIFDRDPARIVEDDCVERLQLNEYYTLDNALQTEGANRHT
jgi:hypothetical protein